MAVKQSEPRCEPLELAAIATLVILHGYVESKNVTTPATEKSTTRAVYRGRRTTTNPTVAATSSTTAATTTKTTAGTKAPSGTTTTKQAGSDREARGKRTLEYGNYGNYNFIPNVPAHTAQRRVSHAYQDPGQYNHFQGNYIQPQYAYQTHHPSSGGAYQGFDADSSNSIGSFQSLPPVIHPHYIEPPEPIIEIIIKESNESLPLDAQTILPKQKKKKEEVQVFYVKYHKDETNGQLVLDDPLPAIKPIPDESEEEEDLSQEPIVVTAAPPLKTTTLRAVINPDSEKYHSNSGIRISFGVEDRHQGGHQISESESESPPSSQQQPPFLSQRPSQAPQSSSFQNERPNAGLRGSFYDASRPVQGGLVQQAAPNLGPTRAPEQLRPTSILSDKEHLANLKHVLPAGGELVPSVSKYEKHITETIVGGSQQRQQQQQQRQQQQQQQQQRVTASPSNSRQPIYNILPSQELISHSVEPTIENVPQNIGPLASNIGPLPTPQKYVSQQAAQVIPNSQPLNFGVNPRFNANAFNEQGAASSTPSTIGTTRTTYSPTFSTTPRTTAAQRYTATPTPTTRQPTPSTTPTPTTRSAQEEAEANAKKQKALFDLPDEVPEDLRAQLLSSGILENADISVLDYDKLGETALENLPPEHLANFFNAGGGSQLAGSSNVLAVVKPNGDKLADKFITQNHDVKGKRNDRDRYEIVKQGDSAKQTEEQDDQPTIVTMPERQNVDLKVVRFDSSNQKNVTDRYIKQDSTILPSVDVTSEQEQDQSADPVFNRYLPLKINGAQFPIPDVAELRGRRIASVVVLAPVDGGSPQLGKSGESGSEEGAGSGSFLINAEDDGNAEEQQQSRFERDVLLDSQRIKFIAGEALKQLIKKPSRENFRRWLDREGKTEVDLQSVVLLVTRNDDNEQEIFMYDIATKGVTHLSGELSAAFVQVAEDNAKTQNFDEVSSIVDTGIVEQMETKASQESSPDYGTSGYALTSSEEQDEQQAQASERKATYVYPENYRGLEVNSGYSNIKK
uniref:Uncharacterized protein n=1 Tax=Anopheles atroparvus TaxID=41427 RepID=A0A182JGH8_ANOAO